MRPHTSGRRWRSPSLPPSSPAVWVWPGAAGCSAFAASRMRFLFPLLLFTASAAFAHVGSPDVFFDGSAGPYRLLVTIRPPVVVPGVAEIEIRSSTPGIRQVHIVPLPLTGPGARFAPTPDLAKPSKDDPQFFTGSLWMMASGSWQVRIRASGAEGSGQLSVPVPALASRTMTMQKGLGALLLTLLLVLGVGAVSIVGASVREGQLEPGLLPSAERIRRSRVVMGAAALLVVLAVWLGNAWWNSEAGNYGRIIFKPLQLTAALEPGGELEGLEDHPPIVAAFGIPPCVAQPDGQDHEQGGRAHHDPGAADAFGGGEQTGFQLAFANGGAYDADGAHTQDQQQREQQGAQALLHGHGAGSQSGHRHGELARAFGAAGTNAHLPGAAGHHPERSGEELGIVFGWFGQVRGGREAGAGAGERQG